MERRDQSRRPLRRAGARGRSRRGGTAHRRSGDRRRMVPRRDPRPGRVGPVASPGGAGIPRGPAGRPRGAARASLRRRARGDGVDRKRGRRRAPLGGAGRRGADPGRGPAAPKSRSRATRRRSVRGRGVPPARRGAHGGRRRPLGTDRAAKPPARDRDAGRIGPHPARVAGTGAGAGRIRARGAMGPGRGRRGPPGRSGRRRRRRDGTPSGARRGGTAREPRGPSPRSAGRARRRARISEAG